MFRYSNNQMHYGVDWGYAQPYGVQYQYEPPLYQYSHQYQQQYMYYPQPQQFYGGYDYGIQYNSPYQQPQPYIQHSNFISPYQYAGYEGGIDSRYQRTLNNQQPARLRKQEPCNFCNATQPNN